MSGVLTAGTLLYDADCGLCTVSVSWAPRLRLAAQVVSIQDTDLAAIGVDPDRAVHELPFIHPDGRAVYGHRAIAAALGTGPFPCRLLGRLLVLPGLSGLAKLVYRWVSTNRSRLPGGTPTCSVTDAGGVSQSREA